MSVTREQIEELMGEAYEVGHAHGGNAFRMARSVPGERVDEGWGEHADKLCELLGITKSEEHAQINRDRFKEFFTTSGDNFMGSGLSMMEWMALGKMESFEASLPRQHLEERRRRWDLVHRMIEEQHKMRQEHGWVRRDGMRISFVLYGESLYCHNAVEAILQGDWLKLKDIALWLTFPDSISDEGEKEHWEPIFADFRALCLAAVEGVLTLGDKAPAEGDKH